METSGTCAVCGKDLTRDEIGATKKFVNRGAKEFLCLPCLSRKTGITEEMLREKIEYMRKYGCTLFAQN